MKKQVSFPIILTMLSLYGIAQNSLPLKIWEGKKSLPLVFYISGDGGFNQFSTEVCTAINKAGYTVTAMNSRSYFWEKKSPEQAAADIGRYLEPELASGNYPNLIFIGYSFGADVLPFIINRLSPALKEKLKSVVLLSCSDYTDFEIHLLSFFSINQKNGSNILSAINSMDVPKGAILFGADEPGIDPKAVRLKNFPVITLPGGHHYDDNTREVASAIMKHF